MYSMLNRYVRCGGFRNHLNMIFINYKGENVNANVNVALKLLSSGYCGWVGTSWIWSTTFEKGWTEYQKTWQYRYFKCYIIWYNRCRELVSKGKLQWWKIHLNWIYRLRYVEQITLSITHRDLWKYHSQIYLEKKEHKRKVEF